MLIGGGVRAVKHDQHAASVQQPKNKNTSRFKCRDAWVPLLESNMQNLPNEGGECNGKSRFGKGQFAG